jgi:hypothetical protein
MGAGKKGMFMIMKRPKGNKKRRDQCMQISGRTFTTQQPRSLDVMQAGFPQ